MSLDIQWFNNPPDPCWDEPNLDESDALEYFEPPKPTLEEIKKSNTVYEAAAKRRKEGRK